MSKKTNVLWPTANSLIPHVHQEFVDIHGVMESALKLLVPSKWANGEPDAPPSSNILFNSMHGLGKSLLAAHIVKQSADILGYPVPAITLDCHEDIRDYHLRGSFSEQADGAMAFVPGPFPAAIHLANEVGACFLIAEEISALTPGSQKMFNSITDWRRGIYIPQIGEFVRLREGARVLVIGTMNPSAYGGVYTLNDDLRSRFDEFEIRIPTMLEEQQILRTICPYVQDARLIEASCQLAKESRTDETDYKLSTRDLQKFVEAWHKLDGELVYNAAIDVWAPNSGGFEACRLVANKFEGTDRRYIVDRIKAIFNCWVNP